MFGRKISLGILFLLAGCVIGASLNPAPLLYQDMLPDAPAEGDSIRIVCIAPRAYVDSEFWLLKMDLAQPVQKLFAPEAQHSVIFTLENITRKDTGRYQCRYCSYHGSPKQMSSPSNILEITVTAALPTAVLTTNPPPVSTAALQGSPWLLAGILSVAGVVLLIVVLVVAVVAIRRGNARREQVKRDQESCWTKMDFPTTDLSFDNGLFTDSVKVDLEATGSQDACISPGSRTRLNVASSPDTSFSTFRALQ